MGVLENLLKRKGDVIGRFGEVMNKVTDATGGERPLARLLERGDPVGGESSSSPILDRLLANRVQPSRQSPPTRPASASPPASAGPKVRELGEMSVKRGGVKSL